MKKIVALLVLFCASSGAAPIVQMHLLGTVTSPGFFIFDIDGVVRLTLCDEFVPGVTTEPYPAYLASLNDLTHTVLQEAGDPLALQKYQQVGMLALQAYLNPLLAEDATWAMRYIVDGEGRLTNGAMDLLAWVAMQNPADYPELSQFIIFAPANDLPGSIFLETQEQVGYFFDCVGCPPNSGIPEPATVGLIGAGLLGLGITGRLRRRAG